MKNKINAILVIMIFLFSSFPGLGQETPPAPAPVTTPTAPAAGPAGVPPQQQDFSAMGPADQQQFLLDNPNDIQNAYTYLNGLGTATFSGQDFDIATNYVNQVDFTTDAQGLEIGQRFFSSDANQVRAYIRGGNEQSLQAENFFNEVTGTSFNLGEIGSDFKYEEGQVTNGGKTVEFTELADAQFVQTTTDGICITSSNGRNNCVGGSAEGSLSYDAEDQSFGFVDQEGQEYSINPVTREGEEALPDVALEVDADGTVRVEGPARATVDSEQGRREVNNRRGTAIFRRDGSFEVENAEVIVYRKAGLDDIPQPYLYTDGKSLYDASANQLVLRNHGDYGLGNARDGVSIGVFTGYTSSDGRNVGFAPDGDGKLTINLDKVPPQSQLDPAPPSEITSESIAEVLREKAKALPLQRGSKLGGDAVVDLWVNQHHELFVQGNGPFETALYEENVLAHHNGMLYRGQRDQGDKFDPEFDLKLNGEMDINMRGKGTLVDSQNGRIAYPVDGEGNVNTHNLEVQAGFTNYQEGSSLAIRDNDEGYRIGAACFDCQAGDKSTTMSKNIIFGKPVIEGRGLFSSVEATTIDMDFVVGSDNVLTLQLPTSILGQIGDKAQQQAALGRSPDIVLTSSVGDKEIEQVFRLSKPGHHESNTIGLYGEFYESVGEGDPQLIAQPTFVDFGASKFLGEEVVAVSEANVVAVQELVFALESGKDIPALDFEPDPDLEEMLLKEGLDIRLLDDPKYRSTLQKAGEKRGNVEVVGRRFKERYRELYGSQYESGFEIDFNEHGICVQPPDCQSKVIDATKKGLALAFDGSLLQVRAREAENLELEARQQSLALDGEEDLSIESQRRENKGRIRGLREAREKLGVKPPENVVKKSESDLEKGIPSENYVRVKGRAVQDAFVVRESDKVVGQLEEQILELERRLDEVDQMTETEFVSAGGVKPVATKVPASKEKKNAARAGINAQIDRINRMIDESLDAGDESYDEVQYEAATKSNQGRYDEAADLLALIGDYQRADGEAQRVGQIDSDKGNALRADIRLRQGRSDGTQNAIAEARSFIDKVEDPQLKRDLEDQIRQDTIFYATRDVGGASRDALVSSNSRFEGALGVNYDSDWHLFGEGLTAAGLETADKLIRALLTPAEALGVEGFQEAGIMSQVENPRSWSDDYLTEHIRDRTTLTTDVNEAEAQLRALRASVDDVDRGNFRRILRQWVNTACERGSSNCASLRHLSDQFAGQSLSVNEQRELLAQKQLSEIKRQEVVKGEPAEIEEYHTVIAGYQGTQAAQVASQEVVALEQEAPGQILPAAMRNLGLESAAQAVATSEETSERYGIMGAAAIGDPLNLVFAGIAVKGVTSLGKSVATQFTRRAALAARVNRLTQPAKEAALLSRVESASGIPIGRMSRPSVARGALDSTSFTPTQIARAVDTPSNDDMLRLATRSLQKDADDIARLQVRAREAADAGADASLLERQIQTQGQQLARRQDDVSNLIRQRAAAASADVTTSQASRINEIDKNIVDALNPTDDVLYQMSRRGELSAPAARRVAEARTGTGPRPASKLLDSVDETTGIRPKETPPPKQQGACISCSGGMAFSGVGGAVCCAVPAVRVGRIIPVGDVPPIQQAITDPLRTATQMPGSTIPRQWPSQQELDGIFTFSNLPAHRVESLLAQRFRNFEELNQLLRGDSEALALAMRQEDFLLLRELDPRQVAKVASDFPNSNVGRLAQDFVDTGGDVNKLGKPHPTATDVDLSDLFSQGADVRPKAPTQPQVTPPPKSPEEIAAQMGMKIELPPRQVPESLKGTLLADVPQQPTATLEQTILKLDQAASKARRTASPTDRGALLEEIARRYEPVEEELMKRADEIEQFRLGRTLDDFVDSTSTAQLSTSQAASRGEKFAELVRDGRLSDEEIRLLAFKYRSLLTRSGAVDDTSSIYYFTDELDNLPNYRAQVSRERGYLDYVAEIDKRFPASTQKVHLGTDGIEYTDGAYRMMTDHADPNSIGHYISRRTLATDNELEAILRTGESVEGQVKIGQKNIRLYEDVNDAIIDSHKMALDEPASLPTVGDQFHKNLEDLFDERVMSHPQNRQKVVDLVTELAGSADISKPMVLTDFAGRVHAQAFTLQKGIKWLGKRGNWKSLTPAQRESFEALGLGRKTFAKAKVDIHVGVVNSPIIENNPLSQMGIEGVYEFAHSGGTKGDVVEAVRGIRMDDASLLTDNPQFLAESASEQAAAEIRRLAIASEIEARKAQQFAQAAVN